MKRFLIGCIVFLSSAALGQPTKSPVSDVLREMLAGREKNTVAAFEEMPADKFGYKPTPEQMTFGHLAAHIVSSNYFFCSNAGDVPRPKTEELKGTEDKDKLVASLKASFEFCHTALAKADDAKLNENITWSRRQATAASLGLRHSGRQLGRSLRDGGIVSPSERTLAPDRATGTSRKEVRSSDAAADALQGWLITWRPRDGL